MPEVGFIGLGTMGRPMAGHLLSAGIELGVWSRTPERSKALTELGATCFETAEDLASEVRSIILCVNRTEDVQELTARIGDALEKGSMVVDHSTIAPVAAAGIASEMACKGIDFVDAPITGGSMGAERGQLTVFVGGDPAACERAIALCRPYTKRAERVGAPGAGQMAKMANQIAVAGSLLGLCESLSFAQKAGLDLGQMKELIGGGAAGSWAFDNYGPRILSRDWRPGFSIENQRKDLDYCRQAAAQLGAAIPGALLVDSLLAILQEEGRGGETTAALFEILERLAPDRN